MPKRKQRSQDEILRDRAIIGERYLKGETLTSIAAGLGISLSRVSRNMKELRQEWRESALTDIDALMAEQLAKIDEVEKEAWAAWHRSIGESVERSVEEIPATMNAEDKVTSPAKKKYQVKRKELVGDPRFLELVGKQIALRCKLLGLSDSATEEALKQVWIFRIPTQEESVECWSNKFGQANTETIQ